jgi:hypothetical protein
MQNVSTKVLLFIDKKQCRQYIINNGKNIYYLEQYGSYRIKLFNNIKIIDIFTLEHSDKH